jgi:hypothetical protein
VTIEGLLVDLFIERRTLHLMDEGEYFRMFANLAGHSRVSLAYARERRPAGLRLTQHIKAEFFEKLRFGQFIPSTGSAGARQRLPAIGLFTIQYK